MYQYVQLHVIVQSCTSHRWMLIINKIINPIAMSYQVNKHHGEHHVFIVLILVNHKNCSSNNLDMQ